MHDVRKITLKNGLRALFIKNPRSTTATVQVLVGVGSDYETKCESGISHFLEHMCFKGTTHRPTPKIIAEELDTLGGHSNAFTNHEHTGYHAKLRAGAAPAALDIVSDIYLNSLFDGKEIEKEKGVIIEEINLYEDLPQRKILLLFGSMAYGDQPAGRSIAGTKQNVKTFLRKDFVSYHKRHYIPSNTVVVVSGNFNSREMEGIVRREFGKLPKKRGTSLAGTREAQKRPKTLVHHKKLDQTHFLLGFRTFGFLDERRYSLGVLSTILGSGMSSRLFQKVREELGAAYYVYSDDYLFSRRGMFLTGAGTNHGKTPEAIRAILEECRTLRDKEVSASELAKAKSYIEGGILIPLERSEEVADFYGGQELFMNKFHSPEEEIRRYRAVSTLQVRRMAREVFRNEKLNFALIGPFKKGNFDGIVRL